MAPDCISNYTGPAYHNLHGTFITNFIFIAFLLLCTILLRVQLVTVCDRLHFYKHFNITFKKLYHVFQIVHGLYQVTRQCCQLYVPACRLKKTTRRSKQQLMQTLPPRDKCIPVLQTRLILICHTVPSPLLAPPTPQRIPALQQDQVTEELGRETFSEPLMPTEDRSSDNETPICQVQPLYNTQRKFTVTE